MSGPFQPFNNPGGGGGGPGAFRIKSGTIPAASFAGDPKSAPVLFAAAFPGSYSVTVTAVTDGSASFCPTVILDSGSGFTVCLGTVDVTGLTEVGWQAVESGEF